MCAWDIRNGKNDQPVQPPKDEIFIKEPDILEVVNNRIFFYSDIDRAEVLKLNKELKEIDNTNISDKQIHGRETLDPIFLHINSYGGSIFSGFSAMDNILKCQSPVITIVDGVCASAATFLSVVGKKRQISRHSFMLIHELQSVFWGKFSEHKDEMQNLERFMTLIKQVYAEYTEIPADKLDEILLHDLFFDAETCLKYKMVDEII